MPRLPQFQGPRRWGWQTLLMVVALWTTPAAAQVNAPPTVTVPASVSVIEDVASSLTGVSFSDPDAGASTVQVTFNVGSGSFAATSSAGVSVSGSGTGLLGMVGSISDINLFVAAGGVLFTTELNNTSNQTVNVIIDDLGNTGTGGAQNAAGVFTVTVTQVNDPPVNQVPGSQSVAFGGTLVFSTGNGNRVSVSDVDLGANPLRVELSATNGVLTLNGAAGLVFLTGNGTMDSSMTFEGALTAVNSALNGLIFTPTPGYIGQAVLSMTSSDLGAQGSGGTRVDFDTIAIDIQPAVPAVLSVTSASPNGLFKQGDVLTLSVIFDRAVGVTGTPLLRLATGGAGRDAVYVSGSGTSVLTFSYGVQAGDSSADLDYLSTTSLALSGGTVTDVAVPSVNAALTLPPTGSAQSIAGQKALVIDGIAPSVVSLAPVGAPPAASTAVTFALVFSEPVTGVNTSAMWVSTSGSVTGVVASLSGSGANYTVTVNNITGAGTLALHISGAGTGIVDAAGNPLAGGFAGAPFSAGAVVAPGGAVAIPLVHPAVLGLLAAMLGAVGAWRVRRRPRA